MTLSYNYTDPIASAWSIKIEGNGIKRKLNPCKYPSPAPSRDCQIPHCKGTIRINSPSGLCSVHKTHTADLVLSVSHSGTLLVKVPTHAEMIEQLIDWAQTRNYKLEPFFESLSFNILGNIPDVSTLDGRTRLSSSSTTNLPLFYQKHVLNVINQFFPSSNNASYQVLKTKISTGVIEEIPARVLALIFASLVFCEEANRGDRWFYRTIVKDESRASLLGGAMPIAYFAARQFNWGVEMKQVIKKLFM